MLVPYGKSRSDTAILLLAEAQKQGLPSSVVKFTPRKNGFEVPDSVGKSYDKDDTDSDKPVAKKTAAKKTTAKKKTAASKAAEK